MNFARFSKGLLILSVIFVSGMAFADEAGGDRLSYSSFAALLGLGLAAFGGALGQGKAVAAALEGISRNPTAQPKIFTPLIIGLAFIESLVIYAWVMSFIKG